MQNRAHANGNLCKCKCKCYLHTWEICTHKHTHIHNANPPQINRAAWGQRWDDGRRDKKKRKKAEKRMWAAVSHIHTPHTPSPHPPLYSSLLRRTLLAFTVPSSHTYFFSLSARANHCHHPYTPTHQMKKKKKKKKPLLSLHIRSKRMKMWSLRMSLVFLFSLFKGETNNNEQTWDLARSSQGESGF